MIDAPSHDDVVKLWSAAVQQVGGEPGIIVLPAPGEAVAVAAFHPVEEVPLVAAVVNIVEGVYPRLIHPCRWMAMAMPGYTKEVPVSGPVPQHGDLQSAYKDGDENVREALSVLVLTGDTDTVMMRTYFQPLLEPEDEVGQADDDGPMAYALRMGLLMANMPENVG